MWPITSRKIAIYEIFAAVMNGKGGVGKSTLAQILIEWWLFKMLHPLVVQVDAQARLSELNSFEITSVASTPELMRANPAEQLSRFAVITDKAEAGGKASQPVLVDIGANEDLNFAFWAQQCEFSADLEEFGYQPVIFVVFTAEQEAIEKAVDAVRAAQRALPMGHVVLVENQRFNAIDQLHPASSARQAFERLMAAAPSASYIVMPKIAGDSYARFEPHRLSFSKVVQMTPSEITAVTGLPRADAKICRGDVAFFLGSMFQQLDDLFVGGDHEA
ncbi:P-loop NTPase family protein [Devosia beringensis]|uniref:hypothetical protein n=1 Tax=Devosia beringensis TaxID=2657486 RepID=UPI00186B7FDB|nr:hypothetical protein [Devosia beringensis]